MRSTLAFASLLVAAVGCDDTATLRITFEGGGDRALGQSVVGAGTCGRSSHCVVFGSVPTTVYDVP